MFETAERAQSSSIFCPAKVLQVGAAEGMIGGGVAAWLDEELNRVQRPMDPVVGNTACPLCAQDLLPGVAVSCCPERRCSCQFHEHCLTAWLSQSGPNCPCCRRSAHPLPPSPPPSPPHGDGGKDGETGPAASVVDGGVYHGGRKQEITQIVAGGYAVQVASAAASAQVALTAR